MTNPQPPTSGPQGQGPYLSPEQALQQQLVQQGYDPNSKQFWDVFTNLMAQVKAQATASNDRAQQSQQLSQGVDFRTGLPASDTNYLGIDHAALKQMVQTVEPAQVTSVSSSWTQIANAMATFGQQLQQAATKSGATWKGDAAESAYNFVSGLGKWSDDSGKAAQVAADQIYNQSSAGETAKNSMPDPIPFSWSAEAKSWASSNPLDLVQNIQNSMQKAQQSQQAHEQAAQVMSTYDGNLHTAAAQAPAFNNPPTFSGPGAASAGNAPGGIGGVAAGAASFAGGTGGSGGHASRYAGSAGGSSGSVSGSLAGLTRAPSSSLAAGAKTGGAGNSGTSAQSYQPPNSNLNTSTSGPGSSNLSTFGGMPIGPMGGGFTGGDDEAYAGKVGRGGSFGPGSGGSVGGGSAAGSGSAVGSGSATGAGAQTGAGARAGGAGAAESAAGGRGTTGSTGRSGTSGMGGHGGKGEGGEDEEHQRPSWLIEPDPDDIFGTTERTAPPVIGE